MLGLAVALPGVFLVIVLSALRHLRTYGPQVGGTSIAERLAQAEVDDRPAPAFELPALDGTGKIALRDYEGRVTILNFWASCRPACRKEAPILQAVWESYRRRGVRFLGVNHRDERGPALTFERDLGITYPGAFDPAGNLATEYRLVGIPTTFVIREDQTMAYGFLGIVDAATLRTALERVLVDDSA